MSVRPGSVLPAPAYGDAVRAWYDAAGVLLQPWRELLQPQKEKPCGCEDEERCRCGPCDCCVPDADIVLHARAGERRVVPLLLRNPGRRPLAVTLDVGPFTPCGAPSDLSVESLLQPDAQLQLAPCEERILQLVLDIGTSDEEKESHDIVRQDRRRAEHCATLVADVRLDGCGSRPVRVGLVVLPSVCDAYEVRCDCGCC